MADKVRTVDVKVACAGCGMRFDKAASWLTANSIVPCPGCGMPIHVRRYKAQAAATALFKKLTGFAGGTKGS